MTSAGRKRKHPGPELAPLGGEVLAHAILSLPSQPQSGCCRVVGCQEPVTPGYHKKYRICLTHSTREQLCLDGKTTCRWCQQCGSFHNLEEFDANYRSCRRSLARHQERRKHRNLLYGTRGKKNKQARQRRPEQQARQDEQSSQQGEAQHKAQPQPQLPRLPVPPPLPVPLPLSPPAQPVQPEEAQACKSPHQLARQHRRQHAGGSKPVGHAEQASATATTPRTKGQPSAEQPPQPEQSSSGVHPQGQHVHPPPATMQPPASMQPVTPPGQPGNHVARSLPSEPPPQSWAAVCAPSCPAPPAPPQQHTPWPLLHPSPSAPAAPAWGQQAPDRGWLLIVGDQRLVPAQLPLPPQLSAAICEQQQQQQQPAGQAIWLLRHAQQDLGGSGGGGGGSGSSGATYYSCYEPAVVQGLLPVPAPAALQLPIHRQFAEAAVCSGSTPAAPLSPCMAATHSLQPCGSGVGSTYLAATPLSPLCGGSSSAPPSSPHQTAGMPGRPAVWVTASLPQGPVLLPAPPLPDGCTGSSNALSQTWVHEQQAVFAAAAPHSAAQLSLLPSLQPSPRAAPLPSLPPSLPPSWQPSSALCRLPSLPPPRASLGCQPSQPWQQQQQQPSWHGDCGADEALIASQLSCPQSPAVSWLNGF